MNRSLRRTSRAPLAALGVWLAVLVLLAPSWALAGLPYQVQWLFTEENPACERADLKTHNGDPFFRVNDTPLPTYQVPGALVINSDDGWESNTATAEFDSVLLRTGDNNFLFQARNTLGNDSCVHQHNVVSLISAPLGLNKPLFNVRRDGTAFVGNSNVSLGLAEINPPLARDIVNLETVIADNRAWLIDHATEVADLAAKLSLLQQLDTELRDLVTRPLDEIATTDLDAILDRYAGVVDAATKAALDQLIVDLKQSVVDLEDELASLIDDFGAQADAVADLATRSAREAGFDPDDPASYALGASNVPWVDVPDISGVPDAFSPGNDPYAAYADKVIATLAADVSGGKVTARADFVANVRAWRANQAALQQALAMRASVSQAETSAFLNGLNSVTAYVKQFMDASDWFLDTSAPPALRAYIDGVLKQGFGQLSDEMKDNLNIWSADSIDLSQTQLFQTISAFGGAMSTIGEGVTAYADVMQTLVTATSRIGVGFVPFVGPALDLCECVTGKAWCLPSGKALSDGERIFSGAGVAIGSVAHFYAGVKNAGVSPAATLIAGEVAKVDEVIAQGLHANPRTWYKTLRGAASELKEPFEKTAGKWMQKDGRALIGIGDDGVRKVLGIPKDAPAYTDLAKAADFLSVTKGNKLAISEVKAIVSGSVEAGDAIKQLRNTLKKATEKGLAGDVERIELIIPKDAPFKNTNHGIKDGYLIDKVTGKAIEIDGIEGIKNVFIKVIQL